MTTQKASRPTEMTPVRPLGEFLLDTSKYQAPPFNDLKCFNNRVCSNLLYFQTNYLAISLITFVIFTLFGFNKVVAGSLGIISTGLVVLFALDRIPQASSLRAQYPVAVIGLAIINTIVCYMSLRSITYVLLAVLIPILFSIVHASMRSRGVSNKVKNKLEQAGVSVYGNTPMGFIFALAGIEAKDNLD